MPTFYGDLWITHIPMGTSVLFTTGGGIYDARSQDFFLVFIPRLPRGSSNDPICIRNINERGKSRSDFKQLLSEFPFYLQMCIWRLKFYIYLSLSHVQFHSSHTIFLLHICHSFYAVNYLSPYKFLHLKQILGVHMTFNKIALFLIPFIVATIICLNR